MSIREDLKAFVDGELEPARTAEVMEAINADPELQQEVALLRLLSKEIKEMSTEPQPIGFEKTMAEVSSRGRGWIPQTRKGQWTLLAAGLCGIVFFAILSPVFSQAKMASKKSANFDSAGSYADKAADPASEFPGEMAKSPAPSMPQAPMDGTGMGGGMSGKTSGGFASNGTVTLRSRPKTLDTDSGLAGEGQSQNAPSVPPLDPNQIGRRDIIQTQNLTVKVVDARKALNDATKLVKELGGYVASGGMTEVQGSQSQASIVMRIPAGQFSFALEKLRAYGDTLVDVTSTDDVTGQIADVTARLKVLRAEEDSYVTMLRGAKKIGELMEIKDRLSGIRQEIESMDAQRKSLKEQAAFSTINATFTQRETVGKPEVEKAWAEETWASAVNGLTAVGRFLGTIVINIFVFMPVWLPVFLVAWYLRKKGA